MLLPRNASLAARSRPGLLLQVFGPERQSVQGGHLLVEALHLAFARLDDGEAGMAPKGVEDGKVPVKLVCPIYLWGVHIMT